LNGQGSECTEWTLESASAEGKFYIRSNVSDKYLYAADGNKGTMVELSSTKTTWEFDTTTIPGYVAICYSSTSGQAVNNNVNNDTKTRLFDHGTGNGASFWLMEQPVDDELGEGESGTLTYDFYFRGISVGRKEFRLTAGSAYPAYEEYIPKNYYVTSSNPLPSGTVHLKSEWVEIPVERKATESAVEAIGAGHPTPQHRYYDLQGRHHTHPTKGLYIVDGKKVVIK
jgi:hypothetical protein